MHVLNWIITSFYLERENAESEYHIDEPVDMHVNLADQSVFWSKNLSGCWSNVKNISKNPSLV